MADGALPGLFYRMRHKSISPDQKAAGAARPTRAPNLSQNEIGFAASPDEAARKSYFSPVNPGSLPGHEVQHWLAAEAQWLAERKLTRAHGFHKQTQSKTNHQTKIEGITIL
jgi:hypothetical protein